MGQTVGDIGKEYFKQMLRTSLEKTTDKALDINIDQWFKKYKNDLWQHAIKDLKSIIEPREWKEREQGKITGICLGSVDKPNFVDNKIVGVKDNIVSHGVLTEDGLIQISDKGTPDVKWGREYTFDCTIGETDEKKKWYMVNENTPPIEGRTFTETEILKKLNEVAKPLSELTHGEVTVVKVRMTHNTKQLQYDPYFDINGGHIQLRMMCSGKQYTNEVNLFISFFINPQKFGEQIFKGMFNDKFYSYLKGTNSDEEAEGIIRNWLVPEGELETFVVGRVSKKHSDNYPVSYSMSPVFMMMIDEVEFDMDAYIKEHAKEVPEGVEVTHPEEHYDFYLKSLEDLGGVASIPILSARLMDRMRWDKEYIEDLTNELLSRGTITEPLLNNVELAKEESSEPEEDLEKILVEILEAYVTYNEHMTVEELAEAGYKVSAEQLKEMYDNVYPSNDNVVFTEKELISMTVIGLKDLSVNYNIDTKGMKKGIIIKSILEAQNDNT